MRFIIGFVLYLCVSLQTYGIENRQTDNKTWVYVVSNGDNLWNITSKFLKKIDYYTDLQKINNIKYPKRINPGTVIRIPMSWLKHSPATARVAFQQGNNQYLRNEELHPLTLATKLVLGDEVRIGDDASATVVFADQSEMVLFKNTIVAFDHLSAYGKTGMVDTRIRVIQGKVETSAQKNKGPGSRLDISTPSAISSVRGTQYRVSNTTDNISTVEVIEGNVAVAGEEPNKSISVTAGLGTRIEQGKPPSKPVKLLPPPQLNTSTNVFESTPFVSWEALPKAARYNIQLSDSSSFKSILWQALTTENSIHIPVKLSDGKYFYRVTAFDDLGIEGVAANAHFSLNLYPYAPKLNGASQRFNSTVAERNLSWEVKPTSKATSYLVELASDEKFKQKVIEKHVKATEFSLPDTLAFGDYYWRVSSLENNDKGPASPVAKFNWATKVSLPNCFVDQSEDSVKLSWSVISPNQNIVIQAAQNSEFSTTLNEYRFDNKTTELTLNPEQELFIRCKVVLPNTQIESQWSETQHISQIDKGILSLFGFILLVILI